MCTWRVRAVLGAQSQQTLKLDEAVTRMRLLEKEDAALRDNNATITSRNGVLEDMVRAPAFGWR